MQVQGGDVRTLHIPTSPVSRPSAPLVSSYVPYANKLFDGLTVFIAQGCHKDLLQTCIAAHGGFVSSRLVGQVNLIVVPEATVIYRSCTAIQQKAIGSRGPPQCVRANYIHDCIARMILLDASLYLVPIDTLGTSPEQPIVLSDMDVVSAEDGEEPISDSSTTEPDSAGSPPSSPFKYTYDSPLHRCLADLAPTLFHAQQYFGSKAALVPTESSPHTGAITDSAQFSYSPIVWVQCPGVKRGRGRPSKSKSPAKKPSPVVARADLRKPLATRWSVVQSSPPALTTARHPPPGRTCTLDEADIAEVLVSLLSVIPVK